VSARGSGIDEEALQAVLPRIVEALNGAAAEGVDDPYTLQQLIRRVVGKWVNETYRRRPMILPVVVSV
jgi:ribonuclease J